MKIRTADPAGAAVASRLLLSIDDDPNIGEILDSLVRQRGYDIATASNGIEGFEKAIEMKPDLITLDITMPGMDGWLLLKKLKSTDIVKDIPVVVLSVFDEKKMGYELGAFGYLLKPFDINDIFDILDRVEKIL
jgi:DNA-binding response OmpR family regulator